MVNSERKENMFEKNKDFYPTPKRVIEKMMDGIQLELAHTILEPSAGSGNIVEWFKEKEQQKFSRWSKYTFNIDCIELDQNLRHILKGKGFRVVGDDFLNYQTMKKYDLIVMNPPFSNGYKHLLKALEIQEKNGGAIVCLLNAETIKNPYSAERKALQNKLDRLNANIEFINDAFIDAERKTNVEIALIKVIIPEKEEESFLINRLQKANEKKEENDNYKETQLVENDYIQGYIKQYNFELEAGIALIKEYHAMRPYILSSFEKDKKTGETIQTGGCILKLDLSSNTNGYSNKLSINSFIQEVRMKYWDALFKNPRFTGQLTTNLKKEFIGKVEELKDYDFSMYNIIEIKKQIFENVIKGVENSIVELFDELSHKYSYLDNTSNNIHYYNGWKTNKAHIINRKVIIPLNAWDLYFKKFRLGYSDVYTKLSDIEKCFNYLDGGLTDGVEALEILGDAEEKQQSKDIKFKYFNVTFYKKGTCHITFTNENLLKKFNIFGSQSKGWLPPCYGKKNYNDMTQEEKRVIDSFEGERNYQKVINNPKYYLSYNSMNLLEVSNKKVR